MSAGPDLVGPRHRQVAQQVGVDLVPRAWLRGVRPAVDRLDAHPLHQRRDVTAADLAAFRLQHVPQHPAAREGMLEVQLVDPAHQREIGVRGRPRQIVDAAPADPERLRLSGERQFMGPVDHRLALASSPALPSAPAKKSLASVNSPIFACRTLTSTAGAASALAPHRTPPSRPPGVGRAIA